LLLFSSTGFAAGQATEGVGIGEQVTVGVDRGDHGIYQSLSVYCRFYALDSCSGGFNVFSVPGTLYHYLTVDDPDAWYEENREGGNDQDSSQSDSKEVHSFD